MNYDTVSRTQGMLKAHAAPDTERKQINAEAKNSIVKLEAEIRKKYA